jgi:hypothetical protein
LNEFRDHCYLLLIQTFDLADLRFHLEVLEFARLFNPTT